MLLDVLPDRLGLEVSFLWFQALKRYRREWQKGNASLESRARSARETKQCEEVRS